MGTYLPIPQARLRAKSQRLGWVQVTFLKGQIHRATCAVFLLFGMSTVVDTWIAGLLGLRSHQSGNPNSSVRYFDISLVRDVRRFFASINQCTRWDKGTLMVRLTSLSASSWLSVFTALLLSGFTASCLSVFPVTWLAGFTALPSSGFPSSIAVLNLPISPLSPFRVPDSPAIPGAIASLSSHEWAPLLVQLLGTLLFCGWLS